MRNALLYPGHLRGCARIWIDFVACLCVFVCVHQSVCLFVCCMVHLSFSQTLFPSTELAGCCIDVHKANTPSECAWRCSASPPHFWKYLCRNLSRSSQCEGHMTPTMFLKGMSHWHAAMGIKLSYILWGFAKDGRRRCTADIFFLTDYLPFIIYSTHAKTICIIEAIIVTWLKAFGVETHFNLVWQWWQHTLHCCVTS